MRWIVAGTLGVAAALLGMAARAAVRGRGMSGSFQMTAEDRLWLGRALVGESGGEDRQAAAAVAWSMRNRFEQKRRWSTFTALLRAYCQPINPKWESLESSGCRRNPSACTQAHLTRRANMRNLSWDAMPQVTKQVVMDMVAGRLENPVDDRNTFLAHSFTGADLQIGGNWFGKD